MQDGRADGVSDGISGVGASRAAAAEMPSSTQGPKIGGFTKSFQDLSTDECLRQTAVDLQYLRTLL